MSERKPISGIAFGFEDDVLHPPERNGEALPSVREQSKVHGGIGPENLWLELARWWLNIQRKGHVIMEKYKILIIEDDPIIQTELQVLLNGNGYEASAVTDFTSVMQAVKNTHPYLILLDIKLPQESGYSICSQIRSFSNVPIIFVTSCNTDMDELNSIFAGWRCFYHQAL